MKKRLLCVIIAISLLMISILLRISRFYSLACDAYSNDGIKSIITRDINLTLTNMLKNNISYDDITDTKYLYDGRIGSISVDTVQLNLLAGQLTESINECIENSKTNFGIPIGNTLGLEYLSGKGPEIPLKVVTIGSVVYEIESEIITAGINQSLHRIGIRFDTSMKCIAPFHNSVITISLKIIVAETVIIGEVPNIFLAS